ncbi:MAG: Uma2 family endonuclease [Pyrinomonadaceae bacterium]
MAVGLEIKESTIVSEPNSNGGDLFRLSVSAYDKMVEQGIFNEDDRIELWDGVLVRMSPKGIRHSNAIRRIDHQVDSLLGEKVIFTAQDPIRLDDFSEPEPDVVLLVPPIEKYDAQHPGPEDIYLIIEIADTSIERDRAKAAKYASNGIAQYLILNLNNSEVEDYREPSTDGYRTKRTYMADETIGLVAFPDIKIRVCDLLPKTR